MSKVVLHSVMYHQFYYTGHTENETYIVAFFIHMSHMYAVQLHGHLYFIPARKNQAWQARKLCVASERIK